MTFRRARLAIALAATLVQAPRLLLALLANDRLPVAARRRLRVIGLRRASLSLAPPCRWCPGPELNQIPRDLQSGRTAQFEAR
jgi:hypothetical protein